MKKKCKHLFNRVVAMLMAMLTAISIIPTSTVMAASQKATITFEYAYDSKYYLFTDAETEKKNARGRICFTWFRAVQRTCENQIEKTI